MEPPPAGRGGYLITFIADEAKVTDIEGARCLSLRGRPHLGVPAGADHPEPDVAERVEDEERGGLDGEAVVRALLTCHRHAELALQVAHLRRGQPVHRAHRHRLNKYCTTQPNPSLIKISGLAGCALCNVHYKAQLILRNFNPRRVVDKLNSSTKQKKT